MKRLRIKRPSAALVVATIALFVALGGTAGAVVTQVALAKRALVADNAKKVNGFTATQVASAALRASLQASPAGPRPASSVVGLVSTKTAPTSFAPDQQGEVTLACDAGQKVVGGGFVSDGSVRSWDSYPASESAWRLYLDNVGTTAANITLYAICVR
jgi:hypothetical protein